MDKGAELCQMAWRDPKNISVDSLEKLSIVSELTHSLGLEDKTNCLLCDLQKNYQWCVVIANILGVTADSWILCLF